MEEQPLDPRAAPAVLLVAAVPIPSMPTGSLQTWLKPEQNLLPGKHSPCRFPRL